MIVLISVAVLLALSALVVWMAGGVQSERTFKYAPLHLKDVKATQTSTSALTVVVWNIAWGYGWGSEGSGKAKPAAHFEGSLKKMGAALAAMNADVVLLQEVDFGATRSGELDQAKALARYAGLPYIAKAESWTANWVPFPYWPPSDHFGRMASGGAVLSRYPITDNEVELLAKPSEYPFWYRLFYLFRFLQRTEVDLQALGGGKLQVFNTHLEAFKPKNRQAQADHVAKVLGEQKNDLLIFGGDLNSAPPESSTLQSFPDEPKTSFEGDRTVATLRSIDKLKDTISPETFSKREADYFTFPAHKPNRKLDYLFVSERFEVLEAKVPKEIAGDVSDHLPVLVKLRIK